MSNTIIISFNNDDRTFNLPKSIIKSYPNSILSLYDATESSEPILISDMTYDQFQIIYDVITNKTKQWLVHQDILKYMDKYGLIDDRLLTLHDNLNKKLNEQISKIDNFINNEQLLLTETKSQYDEYKNLFEHDKNIMTIQMTYECNKLVCINILGSVPIYYYSKDSLNNITFDDEMDINLMRYNMFGPFCCSKCNICEDCYTYTCAQYKCTNCNLCKKCKRYIKMADSECWSESIYSDNNLEYIWKLEHIITTEFVYKKNKSEKPNMLKWSNITNSNFTNNITVSLNKIVDIILQNKNNIIEYYEKQAKNLYHYTINDMISCCSGPMVTPINTYHGFINLTNILQ